MTVTAVASPNLSAPITYQAVTPKHWESSLLERIFDVAYLIFSVVFWQVGVARLLFKAVHLSFGYMVFPGQILTQIPDVKEWNINKKQSMIDNFHGTNIKITVSDGVEIDALHCLGINEKGEVNKKDAPTVYFLHGNAQSYAYEIDVVENYTKNGFNVFFIDYRGFGLSKGRITRDGALRDADAGLQYILKELKVPEDKALVHGHSMGAGVGGELLTKYPVAFCSDRSYSCLRKQFKVVLSPMGVIADIFAELFPLFDWEYNSRDNWEKIKGFKWIISHRGDEIIPKRAGLYRSLMKRSVEFTHLELEPHGLGHLRLMNKAEWPKQIALVKKALKIA